MIFTIKIFNSKNSNTKIRANRDYYYFHVTSLPQLEIP
jgi:hypothetical protein